MRLVYTETRPGAGGKGGRGRNHLKGMITGRTKSRGVAIVKDCTVY